LQVAYYFSTIIKLYFVSFVQLSCVCLDAKLKYIARTFTVDAVGFGKIIPKNKYQCCVRVSNSIDFYSSSAYLKAGAVFFNTGCNEQMFCPKPCKKFDSDPFCGFREKHKNDALLIPKNDITEPKARLL